MGERAKMLRRVSDNHFEEAEDLRDEANAAEKEGERFAVLADEAEHDDPAVDEEWANMRAIRSDRRQIGLPLAIAAMREAAAELGT